MRDAIEFLTIMAFLLAIVFMPIGGLGYAFLSWQCSAYEKTTGKPTKVTALTCYVQQDGVWMHWDEYKLRFATQGAK